MLLWVASRRCEHRLSDAQILELLKKRFDTVDYYQGGATADSIIFASLLGYPNAISNCGFKSGPLHQLLSEVQGFVAQSYSLTSKQIQAVIDAWESIKLNPQGFSPGDLHKKLTVCLVQMNDPLPSSSAPARMLASPMWPEHIVDALLDTPNTD